MRFFNPVALAAALLAPAVPVSAQTRTLDDLPSGVASDTLVLGADALAGSGAVGGPALSAGERVAAWIVDDAEVGNPGASGRPVPDAPAGAVVASFGGGPPFAWPAEPVVWTAPRSGRLTFGLNAVEGHQVRGAARMVVVPLGLAGSGAEDAFPPPAITLERAGDGVRVRYSDESGFGLAPSTLRFVVTTSRGVVYHLSSWVRPGPRETVLPLPPPGLGLPPGIHRLSAAILDHLGNEASAGEIAFDAAP